ncbi:MAG: amidohydrolase family protein [Planctomycetes bacterium]|nr:amidohydrolase family protein [Planctomycetota bacterium]
MLSRRAMTAITHRALALGLAWGAVASPSWAQRAGEKGGQGLALAAAKALVASWDGEQVVDRALVLVKDGKIERVTSAHDAAPEGYERIELGDAWLMPGMVDLHSHIGGTQDINDMVYQTNEGLRVSPSVVPRNPNLLRCLAAGVTTILFIPGSGTNIGGQGILMKTGLDTFEESRLRDPGSLKVAQGDNPTRWAYGMGRSMMNWHIRTSVRRGLGYARRWSAHESGRGERPAVDPQYETFRALASGEAQISTHTQMYQLVHATIRILKQEFGLDVFIDHGEWGGFLATSEAERLGIAAIVGPREVDTPEGRHYTDGAILSCAGEYQQRGLSKIGFNTDAPVVPAEELPLQAAVSMKYGFDGSEMQAVRGLTIVPALVAGVASRVGSLEAGKDADIVVITGDPADPRSWVQRVYIEGQLAYRAPQEPRQW